MKHAKQVSLSMNTIQSQRLEDLAKKLKMPKSRIVNSLVLLTEQIQVLQDLIIKLDEYPGKCTSKETGKMILIVEKAITNFMPYINHQIQTDLTHQSYTDEQIKRMCEIAKTNWVDED